MSLRYLTFDYSEDADGTGSFDAMAAAAPEQLPTLYAEVAQVLAWAHTHWPQACAPLEDGGEWHYDLQGVQEICTPLALAFDPLRGHVQPTLGMPAPPRTTVSLSLSGSAAFCAALREAFGIMD